MTEKELKKEAEKWLDKWELCNKCENKVDCISNFSYCKKVVLQSYFASAEPREKRIAELKQKLEQTEKDLSDYQFNYPTVKELQKENAELKIDNAEWEKASDKWKNLYKLTDNQLTKAKEILQLFLDANTSLDMVNAQRGAEQFLKRR